MAYIDGDAQLVHQAHRIPAQLAEAGVLALQVPVTHEVSVIVGGLHDADAQSVKQIQTVQIIGHRAHVLPAHDQADLPAITGRLEVGGLPNLHPPGVRSREMGQPAGDLLAGLGEIRLEMTDRDVQGIDAAFAQIAGIAIAVIGQAVDNQGPVVRVPRHCRCRRTASAPRCRPTHRAPWN